MDEKTARILGLDLGTSSIGWNMIEGNPKPENVTAMGVRIFPEGMDRTRGEKSLNQDRREARSLRRQTYRRARRKQKLLHTLQDVGLLPDNETTLTELLRREDPYVLRARALDEKLDPWQVGRALYHLGQRRGYWSNRKTGEDKEDGKVAKGVNELLDEMASSNSRTLGEYFNQIDPHKHRIRGRYTSRKMYEDEFAQLWEAQNQHHPELMDVANRQRIHQAIYYQRPLKIQKHLVGTCEFESGRKRTPKATLAAQEFRLWQTLNSLKVLTPEGEENFLTDQQRATLHEKLETTKQLTWDKIREALGLHEGYRFNLEKMRKSGLLGNQTAALVSSAITKTKWKALGDKGREQLVYDLVNIESDSALINRLRHKYRFEPEQIDKLVKKSLELPKGYLHISSKAARNITKYMKKMATAEDRGLSYDQACAAAGYIHTKPQAAGDKPRLPFPGRPAKDNPKKAYRHDPEKIDSAVTVDGLRNPLVERAIYQLRRVVNAIIREYGKPDVIRIEMARDLKSSRKQREDYQRQQWLNEQANQRAEMALREYGYANPTRADKIKYRLWEECGHTCPYTGKVINIDSLFGDHPQFDIEHIIPYSRCLDDSYMNKTLCYRPENETKGNLSPWEVYHSDKQKYEQILQRAKKMPYPKFKRFAKDYLKTREGKDRDFVSQQLNETRYISRKATEYLQQLGCRVEPVKGGTTALLRRAWELNGLLDESGEKSRLDHRHHAVDALVCALTDRSAVQKINRYASLNDHGRLRIENYPPPIKDLRKQAEQAVENIIVSHKALRKLRGGLHDETLYGLGRDENGHEMAVVRMKIADLNEKDIQGTGRKKIRDPRIGELARQHLKIHKTIKNAFANPDNPFGFQLPDGSFRLVNRVRVLTDRSVKPIGKPLSGKNGKRRHVWTRNNHHIEIFKALDKKGNKKWHGRVISTLDARQRQINGMPIVEQQSIDDRQFVMALHQNDMVQLEHGGQTLICRVEKMDQNGTISLRLHTDADKDDWKRAIRKRPDTLRESNARPVEIDVLGNIRIL